MARARNIKPGFFKNEELVELPFETRLLFIGLWTLADREGRMEDRPKRIKMELFPADNVDADACLDQLQASGFILRYAVGESRYIQVVAFGKHQNPHHKEADSTIPAPDSKPMHEPKTPDNPEANPGQAPGQPGTDPADSLNSDSHDSGLLESEGADAPAAPKPRKRSSPKTPVPENFDPMADDKLAAWVRDKGFEQHIEVEVPKFIANHQARDTRMKDWNAAFRYWMTNGESQGWLGRTPAASRSKPTPTSGHKSANEIARFRQLREQRRAEAEGVIDVQGAPR